MSESDEPLPLRHLVLHFDLNKTILTRDPYDHIDSTEIFLCDTICRMAWGEVTFTDEEQQKDEELDEQQRADKYLAATWTLKSEDLTQDSPEESLISYRQYLDICHPFKRPENDEEFQDQTERNKKILDFLSDQGSIFKKQYDILHEKMKLPADAKVDENITGDFKQAYDVGRFNIIPGFFKTLKALSDQKRSFSLAFRTHGRELRNVIDEFNNFCEGKHPAYNGHSGEQIFFNGTKSRDLRIKDRQTGMYFRFGRELSDVNLIMNSLERIQCNNMDDLLDGYGRQIEEGTVAHYSDSIEENYMVIMDTLKKYGSLALHDDFYAYYLNKDDNDFGKLFLVDQTDFTTQHIFFDDMAVEGPTSNIDIRDISTMEKVPERKFRDKYVVRANIYEAIKDEDYFLKTIAKCERARDREIERLQDGILSSEDEEEEIPEDKWETLQNLPNEEYLVKTIAPLLYQGLNFISTERPTNPIEFLALYMLQNKHLVDIPKPQVPEAEGE
ncbi:unnamed protein product [Moneuplotes crassus]|uniref:Uncharacterized protein n=1 Tax=Euplotes crassus TaxID=5936 RepID=A0AAD1UDA5_EUPCR|nr:unnamed protein product [Moneuplotes crassus]